MQSLTELSPVGILEEMFAQEIVRLVARLERTDLTDAERSSTTISLRRDMAELRYLQTDRRLKLEHNLDLPGLASAKEILRFRKLLAKVEKSEKLQNKPNSDNSDPIQASEAQLHQLIQDEEQKQFDDFTNRSQFGAASSPPKASASQNPGRNAPCPCRSGQKYKRCCGLNAPPVLSQAA